MGFEFWVEVLVASAGGLVWDVVAYDYPTIGEATDKMWQTHREGVGYETFSTRVIEVAGDGSYFPVYTILNSGTVINDYPVKY